MGQYPHALFQGPQKVSGKAVIGVGQDDPSPGDAHDVASFL